MVRCNILIYSILLCVCLYESVWNKALLSDDPHLTLTLPQQPDWDSSTGRGLGPPVPQCGCHCGNATAPLSTLLFPLAQNSAEEHIYPQCCCPETTEEVDTSRRVCFILRFGLIFMSFHLGWPASSPKTNSGWSHRRRTWRSSWRRSWG